MELYVKVMFWIYVVMAFTRCGYLVLASYPRERTVSTGEDTVALIEYLAFIVWTAWLLWH